MTPTTTISGHRSASSGPSLTLSLSPTPRHENSVPRNTYGPTLRTRTNSPRPSLRESWLEYGRSSQTSRRHRCSNVHYHPYCERCQTLMGWEPHRLTKPTPKHLIMSFGKLKEYCKSLPTWEGLKAQSPKKISTQWREEQFARAVYKRNGTKVAREALRCQVRWQREDRGVGLPVSGTGTQMSIHS